MTTYEKKEKSEKLAEVRSKHRQAHDKAKELLINMGFTIEKDLVISNKPWDFIAKNHGLTYYIDSKAPFSTKKGSFTITLSEIKDMLKLRPTGIPAYLLMLPDGRSILFTAT